MCDRAAVVTLPGAELGLGIAALPAGLLRWVRIPVPPPPSMHCVLHVERGESPLLLCFEYFLPNVVYFLQGKERIYAVLVPYFYQSSC